MSSEFSIVHINVAVLLLVYAFYHKSRPPGNRLNMSCCSPPSFRGCRQCNHSTGGHGRLIGEEGGEERIYSRVGAS